jgi:hypothetical protein
MRQRPGIYYSEIDKGLMWVHGRKANSCVILARMSMLWRTRIRFDSTAKTAYDSWTRAHIQRLNLTWPATSR